MSKPFKTIDNQIKYLLETKNVQFSNIVEAKEYLLNNNYYNVISCGKIFFCTGIDCNKTHQYPNTNFDQWINKYELNSVYSKLLLLILLEIEKRINSRVAYYLSDMIEQKILTNDELGDLKNFIQTCKDHPLTRDKKSQLDKQFSFKSYALKETWRYIVKMSFGEIFRLIRFLKKCAENRQKNGAGHQIIYNYILEMVPYFENKPNQILEFLKTSVNLRNNLAHNTPIPVYVTVDRNLRAYNERIKNIKEVIAIALNENLTPLDKSKKSLVYVNGLFKYIDSCINFIKLKNAYQKALNDGTLSTIPIIDVNQFK